MNDETKESAEKSEQGAGDEGVFGAPDIEPARTEEKPVEGKEGAEKDERPDEGGPKAPESEKNDESTPAASPKEASTKVKGTPPPANEEPAGGSKAGPIEETPEQLRDLDMLTRKQVVEGLVEKHKGLVERYGKEIDELDIKPPEIVEAKEDERSIRDNINEEVQTLKSKRKELRDKNKKLRSEFFDLLEKEERLKGHQKEVEMYSNFSKDLEWKLETEAITIDNERRLLDELRETIEKMRSITDGYTPEEIKERLNEIQEEIGSNLMRIEEFHSSLLEKVEQSNVHHEKFVDANRQIRERESRRGWLKRRIELHKEMETFWGSQMDQAEKLDSEESGRKIEEIQASLLEAFKQREKDDQKEEEQPEKREGPKDRKGKKRESKPRAEKEAKVENIPAPVKEDETSSQVEKPVNEEETPSKAEEPVKEDKVTPADAEVKEPVQEDKEAPADVDVKEPGEGGEA